jgi:hypothetical protein
MMRSFMNMGIGLCVALAISCATAFGQVTINVDFNGAAGSGTYVGVGAAPDAGTVWNGISPPDIAFTSGPLVDSTGAPTPVTVSLETYFEYAANENAADFARALLTDFVYQTGGLGPNGISSAFAINNLTPGGAYDLYFYAQNGGYSNTETSFTIGATQKNAVNVPGSSGPDSFIENTNYVKFSGVIADGGGVIVGDFNVDQIANNAAFNGLQIQQVPIPEPASVATAVVGGCVLVVGGMLRRRRARAARRQAA